MDNKVIKTPYIKFVGNSSTDVTGSMYLIRYLQYHILLDYGFTQTSSIEKDYSVNGKRPKDIKPKKLDYIILHEAHNDHQGLVPKLYAEGCQAPIFCTKGMKALLTIMWQDSVKIFRQENEKSGRIPLYTQEDVDKALSYVKEVPFHEPYKVNDNITFTYYYAQHIVRAAQTYIELTDGITTKRIGYTGDISNYDNRYWLKQREDMPVCDVLLGETTYAGNKRLHKARDVKTDRNKIDMAVRNALELKSKVVIPTFSLNRLQDIIATIYEMYDGKPPIKVLIDSPLGKAVSNCWEYVIDKDFELWDNIKNSKSFYWTDEFSDSIHFSKLQEPLLVVASGGMLQGGRAPFWVKTLLNNSNNYIIFSGYATSESIAGQLKDGTLKEITIDHTKIKNKAHIVDLKSFSSHCDKKELLDYYTRLKYNKICLVHGEQNGKIEFAKELKNELSKNNKTSRVVATVKDQKVYF